MKSRLRQLDLLRLISILLVMYGHFVMVAGGATAIPGIIGPSTQLPLVDSNAWGLWRLEVLLVENLSTQAAILGVALFFVITGYLMPGMLERYTRREFLVNRFFRIFPVLVIATMIVGFFVGLTQNISFPASSYFASWTLSYLIIGIVPIAGVLWTLVIEVLFYLLACLIGRFSIYRLLLVQAVLLAIVLMSAKISEYYYLTLAAQQAKFLLMIMIGSAIYLAEKESDLDRKVALIGGAILISYLGFQVYNFGHSDSGTYANLSTHLIASGLFCLFQLLSSRKLLDKLPQFVYWIADLVYPIYLLHAAIGLSMMAVARSISSNPYFLLFSAVTASFVISYLVHISVEKTSIRMGRLYMGQVAGLAGNV